MLDSSLGAEYSFHIDGAGADIHRCRLTHYANQYVVETINFHDSCLVGVVLYSWVPSPWISDPT